MPPLAATDRGIAEGRWLAEGDDGAGLGDDGAAGAGKIAGQGKHATVGGLDRAGILEGADLDLKNISGAVGLDGAAGLVVDGREEAWRKEVVGGRDPTALDRVVDVDEGIVAGRADEGRAVGQRDGAAAGKRRGAAVLSEES